MSFKQSSKEISENDFCDLRNKFSNLVCKFLEERELSIAWLKSRFVYCCEYWHMGSTIDKSFITKNRIEPQMLASLY
jgi:hypothetical protein